MGYSEYLGMRAPLGLAVVLAFGAASVSAETFYNDIPNNLTSASPDFSYSMPFDESAVSQFGGLISLNESGSSALTSATIGLSDWATASQYASYISANPLLANATGYYTDVTVNLYSIGAAYPSVTPSPDSPGDQLDSPGSLISSTTQSEFIDWAPAGNTLTTCTDGAVAFSGAAGPQCGAVNLVNVALSTVVPQSFIYTISAGSDGLGDIPADSLNLGLNPYGAQDPSFPGGNANLGSTDPDTAYYSALCTSILVPYACGGSTAGTTNGVAGDVDWGGIGYGAVAFSGSSATPEPATFGLIGLGLVGLGFIARKKKNRKI